MKYPTRRSIKQVGWAGLPINRPLSFINRLKSILRIVVALRSLGIDELDHFLYAFQLRTMPGSKRDVELLGDPFRERNEIRRGNPVLQEAEVEILGKI